jgi:hypothetical protein
MTELPPIERKTNFRDYSSVAMSDFIDILRVKYNLTEDVEYLNDLKFAYLQSLCKYYVVSEHPDGIDLSKRKRKRDPGDKKLMSAYNRFMKIHYCDLDIAQMDHKVKMNAVSKLWKVMSPTEKNDFKQNISVSEMEKIMIGKLKNLLDKGIITPEQHVEKIESLTQTIKIETALENQERIKKEEFERQNRSKFGSQSDIVPVVEPDPITTETPPIPTPTPTPTPETSTPETSKSKTPIRQKRGRGRTRAK